MARRTLFSPFGLLASLLAALALGTAAELVHAASPRSGEAPSVAGRGDFRSFVEGLWPDARAAGVARETFDCAFAGVQPDPKIVALTTRQSEFSRPIWEYVTAAASAARISKGRSASERWDSTLDRIESRYGVPREVVLAVWGMESGFGADTGGFYVVRSLATLASVHYRGDFFRGELVEALAILQAGHVGRADMKGSWAGAMGQTQFMPSSYAAYAVDEDGDGHPNIWTSAPDALASTANYLRQKGWQPGQPWLIEVALPVALDLRSHQRGYREWAAAGVTRVDGRALPESGTGTLFLPAGIGGPAFLLGDNFQVIRAYNSSDSYAMGVGYLANRIARGAAISRPWPSASQALSGPERQEVQKRLATIGLYSGEADGRHGAKTRDAIRAFQSRSGLVSDGYADFAVLKALRGRK